MRRRPLVLSVPVAVAAAVLSAPAGAAPPRLGPVVRVQTPGTTPCPAESETDVVATRAGTWVAYNDMHQCVASRFAKRLERVTSLQLLPAGGGAPRYVGIVPPVPGHFLSGDPAVAPDPRTGGVYLVTMYNGEDDRLAVYRVAPSLAATPLPSPSRHDMNSDDKEMAAADTSPRSRFFGRLYVAWDDHATMTVVVRAFDGRRWLPAAELGPAPGFPHVAVAPNGDVAAVYQRPEGIAVRVSRDGGRTFGPQALAIAGGYPGRKDPLCLEPVVGTRQRVLRAPRAAYDAAGRLHVVAPIGNTTFNGLADPDDTGVTFGGVSRAVHAVSTDGRRWRANDVGPAGSVRFHPVVAPTPDGGVAVAWLQVSDDRQTTYDAWAAVAGPGSAAFSAPVRLSPAPATFVAAMETMAPSPCYGIGDYIGLAGTARGVVAAWPTTDASTLPQVDSDVLVREVLLR